MALNPFRRNKINSMHQPAAPNWQDPSSQPLPPVGGAAASELASVSPVPATNSLINDIQPPVDGSASAVNEVPPASGIFPTNPGGVANSAFPDPSYSGFPAQPEPASYAGFPPAPEPAGPPTPSYDGFPAVSPTFQQSVDTANAKGNDMMSAALSPQPPAQVFNDTFAGSAEGGSSPSYGGFPPPVAASPTTPSYGAFPDPSPSYGGFPGTYSGFPGGGGTVGSTSYSGFPTTSYSAFPEPGDMPAVGDQLHRSASAGGAPVVYNDRMNPDAQTAGMGAGAPAPAQPDNSVLNPPATQVAEAKSNDMMAVAPEPVVPLNEPVSPPPEMTKAEAKVESSAAPVPPDQVGSVAAGTAPTVTPPVFQTQADTANFKSEDMMSTNVTLPVAPAPAEAPPTQPFSALDPGSNVHTPGAQIE